MPRLSLLFCAVLTSSTVLAQSTETHPAASPLGDPIAVINVAGVERVLDDIRWTFESAARNDLNDVVATVLSAVGDLEGLDRERPFGAMAFMAPGGNGQPLVVGYVPVTDLDELMASIAIGPIRPQRVAGKEGVWRIDNPDGNGGAVFVGSRNGYAHVVRDPAQLEIVYPDPARFAKSLSDRYDVAASLSLDGIPPGLRFLTAAGLRAIANNAPAKRSDETDEQYALRKEATEQLVMVANRFVNEGRDVTWGFDYSRERKEVLVELAANAKPGTKLAADLESISGVPSRFAVARDPNAPLAMSLSFTPGEAVRRFGDQVYEQARREAEADGPVAEYALDSARSIFKSESVEMTAWAVGGPPLGMTLLSVVRMKDASAVAAPLVDHLATAAEGREDFEVRESALQHRGYDIHEMIGRDVDEKLKRLVGGEPFAYIATKGDVFWYAAGGKSTANALKQAIDAVETGTPAATSPGDAPIHRPVFSLEARAATLMLLGEDRDPEFEELAQRAFLRGGDELKITLGPKADGFSARFTAAEGWVRLLGLGIAKAYDENQ